VDQLVGLSVAPVSGDCGASNMLLVPQPSGIEPNDSSTRVGIHM